MQSYKKTPLFGWFVVREPYEVRVDGPSWSDSQLREVSRKQLVGTQV